MDVTYDQAESSGTWLQAQSRGNVNEYSHLNERKPKIDHRYMQNAVFNKGQLKSKTNETGDDVLTGHDYFVLEQSENEQPVDSTVVCHDYFVLEKGQSQPIGQETTTGTDAECHDYFVLEKGQSQSNDKETTIGIGAESHDYFVLSKEESAGDSNGNNSASKPKDGKAGLKHDTHGEIQNEINDHTYFENPLLTELEDDIHQYQAMDQRNSNIEPENTNHDYFILGKTNA